MLPNWFTHALAHFGGPFVGLVIGLEAMGLPLPGESLLIAAALYCATTHRLSLVWLLVWAVIGAITGDNLGFAIGRTLGLRLVVRSGRRVGINEDQISLGRYLFSRYGGAVVFFGRFVGLLRTFAALIAGANRMPWPVFLVWNAAGAMCWVGFYAMSTYFLGTEIRRLEGWVVASFGVLLSAVAIGVFFYVRRHQTRLLGLARAAFPDEP